MRLEPSRGTSAEFLFQREVQMATMPTTKTGSNKAKKAIIANSVALRALRFRDNF